MLLDNTPDYLFALGGAALIGAAVVGLNHTRRGEHLLRDVEHTHCALVITEPRHEVLLEAIAGELPPVLVSTRFADDDDPDSTLGDIARRRDRRRRRPPIPVHEPDVDAIWALIFTSGTSDAPKAVICSQRRLLVTGNRMRMIMDLREGDVGYVCMPLFHSSAVQVGWAPSLVTPCAVGLGRRFSASRWLPDVRRYGSTYFNYTGKPLAYLLAQPEQPDDADNTLRVAFGNEGSPEVVESFGRRFGLEVIDAYGATEGGIAVNRDAAPKVGALGHAPEHIQIVDDEGVEKPRAEDRRARPRPQRGGVRRRDRQHAGCGAVRGLLQQRGRNRQDDATRLVLVGRPRLQGRRRLPLLRGPQRRLDPRRRRELPRGSDRGHAPPRARRGARPRSTASPTTRPATR